MFTGVGNGTWYLFVEDPGAVNYFAPLIEAIRTQGIQFRLFADGFAFSYFAGRGFDPIHPQDIQELIVKNKPTLLLVGTSENSFSSGLQFTRIAKHHGVPTVGIVDSGINAAHRFRGQKNDPLAFAPDLLLVPDEWSVQEFNTLGIPPQRLKVIGQPFDDSFAPVESKLEVRNRVLPSKAQNLFVIAFISEISGGLEASQYHLGPTYTLYGRGDSTKRTEIVVEEFLDAINLLVAKGAAKPYLILRRHRKESKQDLNALVDEFDYVSVTENAREIVLLADLL